MIVIIFTSHERFAHPLRNDNEYHTGYESENAIEKQEIFPRMRDVSMNEEIET